MCRFPSDSVRAHLFSQPLEKRLVRGDGGWGRRFLAERRGLAQCDATIAAACRVQSEGSKWRTARCPPTGGGLCPPMGGQGRTASARTTSANIPPRPSTHPNLGALRGGGVTSGLFRWGDRRTSSARGMIGRTTSASLVSLRGRRAQHEYEPVHTPAGFVVVFYGKISGVRIGSTMRVAR